MKKVNLGLVAKCSDRIVKVVVTVAKVGLAKASRYVCSAGRSFLDATTFLFSVVKVARFVDEWYLGALKRKYER